MRVKKLIHSLKILKEELFKNFIKTERAKCMRNTSLFLLLLVLLRPPSGKQGAIIQQQLQN
jgi:hypothetical protein